MIWTGNVYILHFNQPYKHARHYIGYSVFLHERIKHHREGTGAKLPYVAEQNGGFEVARVFKSVDKEFERKLKNRKNIKRYCPLCREIPYNIKGYVEPPEPVRHISIPRAYRTVRMDGEAYGIIYDMIIENITVTPDEFQKRLAKRMRCGQVALVGNTLYERHNKRINKSWFNIKRPALSQTIENHHYIVN